MQYMAGLISRKTTSSILMFITMLFASAEVAHAKDNGIPDETVLIYNVHIINVRDGSIARNKAILIKNNIIEAIGDFSTLQSKAGRDHQVDAGGRYAIPGLWDMHMHIEGENLIEDNLALFPVYIAYGITTVRDAASDLGVQVLAWRDEINSGKLFGPRIFTAGRKLEGIHPIWKKAMEIGNEQDLKKALDSLVNYKVDFVKITENTLAGDLFLKSVIEARKRSFKVSGHVPIDLSIQDLADGGFSSIEHASYLIRLGSDEKNTISQLKYGAL
jgi:hypothetical protein